MESQHPHKVGLAADAGESNSLTLDARLLHAWAQRATKQLAAHKHTINALNVFPVPDSDTGSNMAHTMTQALAKADALLESIPDVEIAALAGALADGAVRGARGNSGVVLSQILRAIATTAARGPIDAQTFTEALNLALEFVQSAIAHPVEGTIITVLRAAGTTSESASLADAARIAVLNAKRALGETTAQLPELKEANVVDAGGFGLVVFLDSLSVSLGNSSECPTPNPTQSTNAENQVAESAHLHESQRLAESGVGTANAVAYSGGQEATSSPQNTSNSNSVDAILEEHGQSGNLEVMFYAEHTDLQTLQQALEPLGDCLIVAPNGEHSATVHIHSTQAAHVISTAYAHATVSDLHIEVLPETATAGETRNEQRVLLVATPPGALAELFAQAGAHVVEITSAQPQDEHAHVREHVVAQVVSAVKQLSAKHHHQHAQEILLLPNGLLHRDELAAASRACSPELTIVATGALVRGLAALAVHDPRAPLAVATYEMNDATAGMRVLALRRATKAHLTAAGACGKHDILAVDHRAGQSSNPQAVRAVFDTVRQALVGTAKSMLQSGGEQVTILIDAGVLHNASERQGQPPTSMRTHGTDTRAVVGEQASTHEGDPDVDPTEEALHALSTTLEQSLGVDTVIYKADALEAITGNIAEVGVE